MKLRDFLPRLIAFASMNRSSRPNRPLEDPEPPAPKEPGSAPEELRQPLLKGRRGKGTRKQRTNL